MRFLSVLSLVVFILVRCGLSADKPLNVILIMADDSAADNYGCYGSTFFKTPILDELAHNGVKFNHCYSEPVCTSSRVKIMTGRDGMKLCKVRFSRQERNDIRHDDEERRLRHRCRGQMAVAR